MTTLFLILLFSQRPDAATARLAETADEFAIAAARLASDRFTDREEASNLLWRAWPASRAVLESAANASDVEVAARAHSILGKARLGIFPDTPPDVVECIVRYQSAETEEKHRILRELYGKTQRAAMLMLLRTETDKYARRNLTRDFLKEAKQAVVASLIRADYAGAETLLAWAARIDREDESTTLRDYAALLLLRDRLDAVIGELRASWNRHHPEEARVLARLLQVKGDLHKARQLADQTEDKHLKADLYYRLEDWAALAQPEFVPGGPGSEILGFTATYQRLAGNQPAFERAIEEICNQAKGETRYKWQWGELLLINGCWREAIDLFAPTDRDRVFDIYCGQMRFSEAFRELGLSEPRSRAVEWFEKSGAQNQRLGILIASALHQLGEREESQQLLEAVSKVPEHSHNWPALAVLDAHVRLGNRDLATKEAVSHLTRNHQVSVVMHRLFGEQAYKAAEWWEVLRTENPTEDVAITLEKLRSLFGHRPQMIDQSEFAQLIENSRRAAAQLSSEKQYFRLAAVAEACALSGDLELAHGILKDQAQLAWRLPETNSTYEPPRTLSPLLRIGELWAEEKQWSRAAEVYREGWQSHQDHPVPLYLCGRALVHCGRDGEGQRLIELAILLPLADTERRERLIQAMQKHGQPEDVLAQSELILRIGNYEGWEGGEDWAVMRAVPAIASHVVSSDPIRAAGLWQRELHYLLKTNVGNQSARELVEVVQRIHRSRALGLLASGAIDEALKEIKNAQAATQGDIELAIRAIPGLAAAGRTEAAEELFASTYDVYGKVIRDFPKSARHLNRRAWLAANCERRLETALHDAREAVRLEPENASFLDTLAEVQFRRGERAEAVSFAEQAIQRAPTSKHFRDQLQRFKRAP